MMMVRLYNALARRWLVGVWGGLVLVFLTLFNMLGPDIPADAPGVMDLQLAFSRDEFKAVLDAWGPAAVDQYADTMWLDYLFPVVYALFLMSAIAAVTVDSHRSPPRFAWRALLVITMLASLCDLAENTLHLIILYDPTTLPPALILLASVAAAIKWGALGLVTVAVLILFAVRMVAVAARIRAR